jgi:putative aldouronate transport system substrate-binding protein
MRKAFVLLISLVMLLSMMAGCKTTESDGPASTPTPTPTPTAAPSAAPEEKEPVETDEPGSYIDPFVKYDTPIDVHMVLSTNPAQTFPEGDDYTKNVWTRAFKDDLNINIIFDWTAPFEQYETKLNLAIATKDLPDIFGLSNYTQFEKLANADMLYDLTDVIVPANMSEQVAGYLEQRPQQKEWATRGGRLLGMCLGGIDYQSPYSLLWRDDWFKEWGGKMPATMEEYIQMAKDFADKDRANRFAFGLTKTIYEGQAGFVGMANANGAYPGVWYEDQTGKLIYGDIQPQMKKVLQTYADLFAEGYIDPAFASYDGMKIAEQLTSGKIGATIAQSWVPGWPLGDLYAAEGVTWSGDDLVPFSDYKGELKLQTSEPKSGMYVVNKNCEHPEALLRIMNFASAKVNGPEGVSEPKKFHSDENFGYHGMCPIYPPLSDVKINLNTAINVTNALDKNDTSYLVTPHDWTQYEQTKPAFDNFKAGAPLGEKWSSFISWYGPESFFGRFNKYYDDDMLMTTKLVGYQSPEMVRSWENLKQYVQQAYTEFIMGTRPIDQFDAFVEEWKNMGGAIVEIEVNEWYTSK